MQDKEYDLIKREILSLTGINLDFYKRPQMERRLGTYLLRAKQPNWPAFFKSIKGDADALQELRNYLTINVSSFFRDTDKYKDLQGKILPELLKTTPKKSFGAGGGALKIWSAGCSRGQEPYTIAMVLSEMTGPTKHTIIATDIDHSALKYARNGGPYTADDVSNVSAALKQKFFDVRDNQYFVKPVLRNKITFKHLNLLEDKFDSDFDLIICRNVVIYFTAEVKDRLYKRFYDALRPGGILFVGGTEIVSKATSIGLETAGISFYRKK